VHRVPLAGRLASSRGQTRKENGWKKGVDRKDGFGSFRPGLHERVRSLAILSLERIHSFWFNRRVKPDDCGSAILTPVAPSAKVIAFSDLRLRHPMAEQRRILIEYEDRPGNRSFHEVSLTCTAEGFGGLIYFGGYAKGKFSIFRADCIHRVSSL
jgi:hypothetical protein